MYLTGWYAMQNLQDRIDGGAAIVDYDDYLHSLESHHLIFIRLAVWEDARSEPTIYQRTGPGQALDGGLKFDLTRFNTNFFARLRNRVEAADQRDIYVCVMLFQGWSTGTLGHETQNPFPFHPFHPDNNINGIDGTSPGYDPPEGYRIHTLDDPSITALQEAYVRKVVETLNDLDNVIYEVSNESVHDSWPWQYHMMNYLRSCEAGFAKQHLVGMSVAGGPYPEEVWIAPGLLFGSPADWVAPPTGAPYGDYMNDPPAAGGSKVVLLDSDHIKALEGGTFEGTVPWAWKSFLRGHQPFCLDIDYDPQDTSLESLFQALGCTRTLASEADLSRMRPRGALASTGYCLADTEAPRAVYLVYLPDGGSVVVDLSETTGMMNVEWIDPVACSVTADDDVAAGGSQVFAAPFAGHAVLRLTSDPGMPVTSTPSITPQGGVFPGSVLVTLETDTPDAVLRYTTDGSTPDDTSPLYEGPFFLAGRTVLRSRAFRTGYETGPGASATFFLSDEPVGLELSGDAGSFVDVNTLTNIVEDFSVELWIYPYSHRNYNQQIRALGGWKQFVFHTTDSGALYVGTDVSSRFSPTHLPAGTLALNEWQHFVFTYDFSTRSARFYRNGVLLAAKAQNQHIGWSGFRIGIPGANGVDGRVDEVRIYDRVLTAGEVAEHYAAGAGTQGAPEAGLVAGWHLDEGTGAAAADYSGNGHPGSVLNGAQWVSGRVVPDNPPPPAVATPWIDPDGGTYTNSVKITLGTSTPESWIYYSLDGSDPYPGGVPYGTPFYLLDSATIRVRAYRDRYEPSPTSEAVFTIETGSSQFDGLILE